VTLTGAASGGGHGAPGSDPDTAVSSDDAAGAREPSDGQVLASVEELEDEDSGGSDGLAIAALAIAVVALAAAGASFLKRRAG
jgi:hypothetical protein